MTAYNTHANPKKPPLKKNSKTNESPCVSFVHATPVDQNAIGFGRQAVMILQSGLGDRLGPT